MGISAKEVEIKKGRMRMQKMISAF